MVVENKSMLLRFPEKHCVLSQNFWALWERTQSISSECKGFASECYLSLRSGERKTLARAQKHWNIFFLQCSSYFYPSPCPFRWATPASRAGFMVNFLSKWPNLICEFELNWLQHTGSGIGMTGKGIYIAIHRNSTQ